MRKGASKRGEEASPLGLFFLPSRTREPQSLVLKTLRSGLHLKTAASPVPFKGVGRTKVLISLDASMGTREAGIRVRREGKKREEEEEEEEKKKRKSCRQVFINRFQVTDFRESLSGVLRYIIFWFLRFVTRQNQIWGEGEREGKNATTAAAAAPLQKQKGDESERTQRLL